MPAVTEHTRAGMCVCTSAEMEAFISPAGSGVALLFPADSWKSLKNRKVSSGGSPGPVRIVKEASVPGCRCHAAATPGPGLGPRVTLSQRSGTRRGQTGRLSGTDEPICRDSSHPRRLPPRGGMHLLPRAPAALMSTTGRGSAHEH